MIRPPSTKFAAIARSMKHASDMMNGTRGAELSFDDLAAIAEHYRSGQEIFAATIAVDMSISQLTKAGDDELAFRSRVFCNFCGSDKIDTPQDHAPGAICRCRACNAQLGRYADINRLASWLAADEWYAKTGQILTMPDADSAFLAGEREFAFINDQIIRRGPLQ